MARVLVAVLDLESHVRAVQHVGRTLQRVGHEVLLAAPVKARGWIETTYRLPYVEAGQGWTTMPGIGEQLSRALINHGNPGFVRTIIEEYLTGPTAVAKARDVAQVIREFKPDAILCDCTDIGGLIAAWQFDLPCIILDNGWTRPLTEFSDSIPVGLRRHWPELDADAFVTDHQPPVITPCPKDLVYPDIPHITDYRVEHPNRINAKLPAWVAELPTDQPLIYASYGSILTQASGFDQLIVPVYQRIIAALAELSCIAILSVGRENVHRLGPGRSLPPNVRLTPRIEQPLLLQAGVQVILTPGGLGTVKEIVTNAVLPVVMPLCSENFHIARRFEETGMGAQVPFSAEPELIAEAVHRVNSDITYRQAARHWQRRSLALSPLEMVLDRFLP